MDSVMKGMMGCINGREPSRDGGEDICSFEERIKMAEGGFGGWDSTSHREITP